MVSVSRVLRGGQRLAGGDQLADARVEARRVADDLEADAVLVQLGDFLLQRAQEQLHQDRHFVGRTAPVLAGEREQRQVFDAALDAGAHGRAHGFDALAMAGDARQHAAASPSGRCRP